jgi:hypothetical protein
MLGYVESPCGEGRPIQASNARQATSLPQPRRLWASCRKKPAKARRCGSKYWVRQAVRTPASPGPDGRSRGVLEISRSFSCDSRRRRYCPRGGFMIPAGRHPQQTGRSPRRPIPPSAACRRARSSSIAPSRKPESDGGRWRRGHNPAPSVHGRQRSGLRAAGGGPVLKKCRGASSPARRPGFRIAMCRLIGAVPTYPPHPLAMRKVCPLPLGLGLRDCLPAAAALCCAARQEPRRRSPCGDNDPLAGASARCGLKASLFPLSTVAGVAEPSQRSRVKSIFRTRSAGPSCRCVTR